MAKFAIRSISPETMALPASDQNRYYSKQWASNQGCALVGLNSKDLLTFRSKKAAEEFVKEGRICGFTNIRVHEM